MKLRMSRIDPVDVIDGTVDASLRTRAIEGEHLGHVLERQPDRVQRLDDAVVQVATDALAFLEERHPGESVMQSRGVDGHRCLPCERLHQPLVGHGEPRRSDLVREVQVADRPAGQHHGHAQEGVHRRMARREAVAARVAHHVVDAQALLLAR